MNLAKRYDSLSEFGKNVFVLCALGVLGFLVFGVFFFMGNPGLPLGWLLGSSIEIIAYLTNYYTARIITNPNGAKPAAVGLVILFSSGRMLLYAAGLVLAALCTFTWKNDLLNVWTVFGAYMPLTLVLGYHALVAKSKVNKPAAPAKKEEAE